MKDEQSLPLHPSSLIPHPYETDMFDAELEMRVRWLEGRLERLLQELLDMRSAMAAIEQAQRALGET